MATMAIKQVKCKSGITGWQCRLQENYADCHNPYAAFKTYARMYNLHRKLGYRSMIAAWRENPLIRGSVIPTDFQKVMKKSIRKV